MVEHNLKKKELLEILFNNMFQNNNTAQFMMEISVKLIRKSQNFITNVLIRVVLGVLGFF